MDSGAERCLRANLKADKSYDNRCERSEKLVIENESRKVTRVKALKATKESLVECLWFQGFLSRELLKACCFF